MKVKMLSRDPKDFLRESKFDIHKVPRNYDPTHHPMEQAREYRRALNAAKLDSMFAKPFLGQLGNGHADFVTCLATHPRVVTCAASASVDGEIKIWNLATRSCTTSLQSVTCSSSELTRRSQESRYVRSLTFSPSTKDDISLISVGDDRKVKLWRLDSATSSTESPSDTPTQILSKFTLTGVTHHRYKPVIATCGLGPTTTIWDLSLASAVQDHTWGVDSIQTLKFNQVEPDILAACASDRSIILYDIRQATPLRRLTMDLRSNAVAWNPMEAYTFVVGNEDYNCYTFDMRRIGRPMNVHKGHTGAVIDLAYAPTGRQFASASYDRTIRLFDWNAGHARDVYSTKRMQRLTAIAWTSDDRYILSASDETNVRLWKARASEKLAPMARREQAAKRYNDALITKFKWHPEVRRVASRNMRQHVPKHVKSANAQNVEQVTAMKRKEANRRAHSRRGEVPYVPERQKHVVQEDE